MNQTPPGSRRAFGSIFNPPSFARAVFRHQVLRIELKAPGIPPGFWFDPQSPQLRTRSFSAQRILVRSSTPSFVHTVFRHRVLVRSPTLSSENNVCKTGRHLFEFILNPQLRREHLSCGSEYFRSGVPHGAKELKLRKNIPRRERPGNGRERTFRSVFPQHI